VTPTACASTFPVEILIPFEFTDPPFRRHQRLLCSPHDRHLPATPTTPTTPTAAIDHIITMSYTPRLIGTLIVVVLKAVSCPPWPVVRSSARVLSLPHANAFYYRKISLTSGTLASRTLIASSNSPTRPDAPRPLSAEASTQNGMKRSGSSCSKISRTNWHARPVLAVRHLHRQRTKPNPGLGRVRGRSRAGRG
jgi:hypothetical protein